MFFCYILHCNIIFTCIPLLDNLPSCIFVFPVTIDTAGKGKVPRLLSLAVYLMRGSGPSLSVSQPQLLLQPRHRKTTDQTKVDQNSRSSYSASISPKDKLTTGRCVLFYFLTVWRFLGTGQRSTAKVFNWPEYAKSTTVRREKKKTKAAFSPSFISRLLP